MYVLINFDRQKKNVSGFVSIINYFRVSKEKNQKNRGKAMNNWFGTIVEKLDKNIFKKM